MRYLVLLLALAGCVGSPQMSSRMAPTQGNESVEYFDAPFDQVVDATMAAVSDLGMYVEDRHRSGFEVVVTVRSAVSGVSYDNLLRVTIERPTAQGVAVRIGRTGNGRQRYSNEAEALLRRIAVKLIG